MESVLNLSHIGYNVEVFKNYITLPDNYFDKGIDYDDVTFHLSYVHKAPIRGYGRHGDFEYDFSISDCDEETYKKYTKEFYSSAVWSNTTRVVIEKNEDKVCLKTFQTGYRRNVADKFFRKTTSMFFITYAFKTGRFYIGNMSDYHTKKRCKKMFTQLCLSYDNTYGINSTIQMLYTNKNDDGLSFSNKYYNESVEIFKQFFDQINDFEYDDNLTPHMNMVKHVCKNYKYKLPDNFESFYGLKIPYKKEMMKVDGKFIDAIMITHGLKGDKIKKVLHLVKKLNIDTFNSMTKIFGIDFLLSKPVEDLIDIFELESSRSPSDNLIQLSKNEKNNAYSVFKITKDITSIIDHLDFKQRLSKYEITKWKSMTDYEFYEEHVNWTEKIKEYTTSTYNRFYNETFKKMVEETINIGGDIYYPILLSKAGDYDLESLYQSNCVRTYDNKPGSVIISLRKNVINGERLTIEYKIRKRNSDESDDLGLLKRVQTKARFNKQPGSEWNDVLNILDNKIDNLCYSNLFTLPKVQIKFKYKLIETRCIFKKNIVGDLVVFEVSPENNNILEPVFDWTYNLDDDDLPL